MSQTNRNYEPSLPINNDNAAADFEPLNITDSNNTINKTTEPQLL